MAAMAGVSPPIEPPSAAMAGMDVSASQKPPAPPSAPSEPAYSSQVSAFVKPDGSGNSVIFWDWNDEQKLMAVMEHTQLLKVIDGSGKTIYRVQLPQEGRTIFLGWEPSGAALAAVLDHGGAFLWFPSKPDCVQQWEGMQFSSQVLRAKTLQRNSHFNTCFANWSVTRKLVLGLADGNFACWDLASNETFISRKHFAGKHKASITCGAWGMNGQILALGSKNQIKISQPLLNASWEATAAKLSIDDNDLSLQELAFSPTGAMLSALAGTSIFRHLCLYAVKEAGGGPSPSRRSSVSSADKGNSHTLVPLGEMHPNATIGGIQELVWLENEMLAVVTTNGYVRLLQYSMADGALHEDQHKPCQGGVVSACLSKKTGHIAIVSSDHLVFFDPLLLNVAAIIILPKSDDAIRYQKMQATSTGEQILIGRSDGSIFRVMIPAMPRADLSLLTVRRRAETETSNSVQAAGMLGASCGDPGLILTLTAADGAGCGYGEKLVHAWSPFKSILAVVNSRNEIVVIQRMEDGEAKQVLREQLPEACASLSWDPSTGSVLAIAIRSYGIALWDTKGDAGVQMWSGMAYKNRLSSARSSQKNFDPRVAVWNLAGQLAVGMVDGSFAVWDSVSMELSTSGGSGKHKSAITAADWHSSLFAPALALASKSTIKVSQGFDGVEWSSTSMKLKLIKDSKVSKIISPLKRRSTTQNDLEGLHFESLRFSPSGKYLAAVATPVTDPDSRQLDVYELQDERKSLALTRELAFSPGEVPVFSRWLIDNSLIVFTRASSGSPSIKVLVPGADVPVATWPPPGTTIPGSLVDAGATIHGLVVLAIATPDSKGTLMILTCPSMAILQEMPLDASPQSVDVHGLKGGSGACLSISFEGGGVEVWDLPPATVDLD